MKVLAHICMIGAVLAIGFAIPLWMGHVNVMALLQGNADLVSSATSVQEAPSGAFTIFINRELHLDDEVLGYWLDFLAGRDVPLIMEDVSCVTCRDDAGAIEMAKSLASRLPANQMKVHTEDAVLVLSKAETGRFDILVMSDEVAEQFDVTKLLEDERVEMVRR